MVVGLPMMKNVLTPLAKSILVPLVSMAGMSAIDAAIQKNSFGSAMTALIISSNKIHDMMKTVKSLEELSLVIKDVSETIKNKYNVTMDPWY